MSETRLSAAHGAAFGCALVGALATARWLLDVDVSAFVPGLTQVGLAAPLLLLLSGATAWFMAGWPNGRAPGSRSRLAVRTCALLIAALPVLMLFEAFTGVSLGIDIARSSVQPTALTPHPGRLSPNACAAFLAMAAGFALISTAPTPRTRRWSAVFVVAGTLIALTGLLGYLLHLERLYHWGSFNRLSIVSAVGLSLLSMAMWQLRGTWSNTATGMDHHEASITRRSLAVLTLIAIAAGAGGFAVMQSELERSRSDDIQSAAIVNGEAITSALDTAVWINETVVTRAVVIEHVARLASAPDDARVQARLQGITFSLLAAGTTAARFVDASGRVLAEAGRFAVDPNAPALALAKDYAATSQLAWSGGFVLLTQQPIYERGDLIGRLVSEQRLPLADRLITRLRESDASADVLVCSRLADVASCMPSKLYPKAFTIPMFDANGRVNLPINRALLGESGVMVTPDLRGTPVVAAYVPLARTGLAMVVKVDVEAVFSTIRQRLAWLALLLAALVTAGTWALRRHVRPLVRQLSDEQARCRAILDNSNDAFIGLDGEGHVTDWNLQAEEMFGYSADEARGQLLSALIIPPELRSGDDAGMERFRPSGRGRLVNQRIEMQVQRRDGQRFDVELSIAAMRTRGGHAAHAFVRDITQRKAGERERAGSEQRMRDITNAIPAMVGVFDTQERCLFANDLALKINGVQRDEAVGMTMRTGLGEASYALHRPYVQLALRGERQSFEGSLPWRGGTGHFQVHLVPMRDAQSGAVSGFYLMTFDITALRQAQLQQERSESHLKAIADNLPVLISYIDPQHRLTFVNRTFKDWLGVDPELAVGVHLKALIGPDLYQQRLGQLERALAGERVEFEVTSVARGVPRHLHTVYMPDRQADGSIAGIYTLATDVTAMKEAERQLQALARNDPLTGLPNRREFESRLPQAIARSRRSKKPVAVVFMDVDHFKGINDTLGHAAGDTVLKEFASRVQRAVRSTDTAARLAGDEFVVILEGLQDSAEASAIAAKLVNAVRVPMQLPSGPLVVTTSIGVACYSGTGDGAEDLLDRADRALYRAKAAGRDTFAQTTF